MAKIDYKKELKHLYRPSTKKVEIVDVPQMSFIMIDGEGDPNTSKSFQDAVEALYAVSYTIKFMVKKGASGIDYGVLPLEGLWWADDMSKFSVEDKKNWKWTLMIMQPEQVTAELVKEAIEQVREKKNPDALSRVR
ncbi:MAG: GyrI-like domain-containing protein, partial [Deltaproteobacteria bacterium]|nr:GyrI-like domain-containing protein [Deltaproteobacteria bacterium]